MSIPVKYCMGLVVLTDGLFMSLFSGTKATKIFLFIPYYPYKMILTFQPVHKPANCHQLDITIYLQTDVSKYCH